MSPERLRQVRGPGVGMVFQDPMTTLNPVLTVGRQLTEGLRAHGAGSKAAARARAAARPGRGLVFQDPMTSLNPVLTVGRQLTEGLRAHGSVSKAAARARAVELL